jgi:hypothetical protein
MRHLHKRTAEHIRVKWEMSKAGSSLGWVYALDCDGRTIWIVDAHRGDGKRYVARADEKLTVFLELESAIRVAASNFSFFTKLGLATQFAPQGSHAEQSQTKQRNC